MSIVLLTGGSTPDGNAEHRHLVESFLDRYGDRVTHVITADPVVRSFSTRLKRMIRRGNYGERWARARYPGGYGPEPVAVQRLLRPDEASPVMPGGSRRVHVSSHNGAECEAILAAAQPEVIAVYGTAIIHPPVFTRARRLTLNMHTGLSPWYRGDSTLFWPVYYDEPDKLGVTVHELVESVDGGTIAATAPVLYEPGDGEAELFAKGVRAGTLLYLDCVQAALDGALHCRPQDLSLGREFSWKDRTVAAEKQVLVRFTEWEHRSS